MIWQEELKGLYKQYISPDPGSLSWVLLMDLFEMNTLDLNKKESPELDEKLIRYTQSLLLDGDTFSKEFLDVYSVIDSTKQAVRGEYSQRSIIKELLQNAFDCKYGDETIEIEIAFSKETQYNIISLSYNEVGFDNYSILKYLYLGKSQKEKGLHEGRFGIGAKFGVFYHTDEIVLQSTNGNNKYDICIERKTNSLKETYLTINPERFKVESTNENKTSTTIQLKLLEGTLFNAIHTDFEKLLIKKGDYVNIIEFFFALRKAANRGIKKISLTVQLNTGIKQNYLFLYSEDSCSLQIDGKEYLVFTSFDSLDSGISYLVPQRINKDSSEYMENEKFRYFSTYELTEGDSHSAFFISVPNEYVSVDRKGLRDPSLIESFIVRDLSEMIQNESVFNENTLYHILENRYSYSYLIQFMFNFMYKFNAERNEQIIKELLSKSEIKVGNQSFPVVKTQTRMIRTIKSIDEKRFFDRNWETLKWDHAFLVYRRGPSDYPYHGYRQVTYEYVIYFYERGIKEPTAYKYNFRIEYNSNKANNHEDNYIRQQTFKDKITAFYYLFEYYAQPVSELSEYKKWEKLESLGEFNKKDSINTKQELNTLLQIIKELSMELKFEEPNKLIVDSKEWSLHEFNFPKGISDLFEVIDLIRRWSESHYLISQFFIKQYFNSILPFDRRLNELFQHANSFEVLQGYHLSLKIKELKELNSSYYTLPRNYELPQDWNHVVDLSLLFGQENNKDVLTSLSKLRPELLKELDINILCSKLGIRPGSLDTFELFTPEDLAKILPIEPEILYDKVSNIYFVDVKKESSCLIGFTNHNISQLLTLNCIEQLMEYDITELYVLCSKRDKKNICSILEYWVTGKNAGKLTLLSEQKARVSLLDQYPYHYKPFPRIKQNEWSFLCDQASNFASMSEDELNHQILRFIKDFNTTLFGYGYKCSFSAECGYEGLNALPFRIKLVEYNGLRLPIFVCCNDYYDIDGWNAKEIEFNGIEFNEMMKRIHKTAVIDLDCYTVQINYNYKVKYQSLEIDTEEKEMIEDTDDPDCFRQEVRQLRLTPFMLAVWYNKYWIFGSAP
ncbi:ATP-binding protein [Paenibacillus sp. FSL R7-0204]|uniref:ATP-binding protein n=1 Tax=Paenibacillus sp. FSL R7-0204 TaxID=2921675 RepID=UPI0030F88F17